MHVLIVLKSGSLNLLEPSGPVKACNGTALPLLFQWWTLFRLCPSKEEDFGIGNIFA
jgi:hypothetical protein